MNIYKEKRLLSGSGNVHDTAKKLGIADSTLWSIENGTREPGKKLIVKMAKLYKCKTDDFFLQSSYTECIGHWKEQNKWKTYK